MHSGMAAGSTPDMDDWTTELNTLNNYTTSPTNYLFTLRRTAPSTTFLLTRKTQIGPASRKPGEADYHIN